MRRPQQVERAKELAPRFLSVWPLSFKHFSAGSKGNQTAKAAHSTCMATLHTYTEDLQIAQSLILHDEDVTRRYFYKQCYPLFKSVYDNYYTDCESCKEFIDEIYILVLAPSKSTGKCQLENFRGESTLTSWLKTVCLYYCYNKFEVKRRMPIYESFSICEDKDEYQSDRLDKVFPSIDIDFHRINRADALTIIGQMPNKRYSNIIRLRYLEQKSNEETAEKLGMTMENFYNKHKLAKEQYILTWRKEANNE